MLSHPGSSFFLCDTGPLTDSSLLHHLHPLLPLKIKEKHLSTFSIYSEKKSCFWEFQKWKDKKDNYIFL